MTIPPPASAPTDALPVLRLKRNEDRRLAAGHLWVFSNEVDTDRTPLGQFVPGTVVELRSHRDAFASLTAEIGRLADDNRELLAMSHRATQETLATLEQSVATYDGSGQSRAEVPGALLIDRSI
jgi:hypothetical protein